MAQRSGLLGHFQTGRRAGTDGFSRPDDAGDAALAVVQSGKAGPQFCFNRSYAGPGGLYHSPESICAAAYIYAVVFVHLGFFPGALASEASTAVSDLARPGAGPVGQPAWGLHHGAVFGNNNDRDRRLSDPVSLLVQRRKLYLV